jgi:hypothetical protein
MYALDHIAKPFGAGTDLTKGFNIKGAACTGLSTATPNDCRFQYQVKFTPKCGSAPGVQRGYTLKFDLVDSKLGTVSNVLKNYSFEIIVPATTAPAPSILQLSFQTNTGCVITADNKVKCWGSNHAGMLGRAMSAGGFNRNPMNVVHPGTVPTDNDPFWGVDKIVNGNDTMCIKLTRPYWYYPTYGAITSTVKCWGENFNAGLGVGVLPGSQGGPSILSAWGDYRNTETATRPVANVAYSDGGEGCGAAGSFECNIWDVEDIFGLEHGACATTTNHGILCWGELYNSKVISKQMKIMGAGAAPYPRTINTVHTPLDNKYYTYNNGSLPAPLAPIPAWPATADPTPNKRVLMYETWPMDYSVLPLPYPTGVEDWGWLFSVAQRIESFSNAEIKGTDGARDGLNRNANLIGEEVGTDTSILPPEYPTNTQFFAGPIGQCFLMTGGARAGQAMCWGINSGGELGTSFNKPVVMSNEFFLPAVGSQYTVNPLTIAHINTVPKLQNIVHLTLDGGDALCATLKNTAPENGKVVCMGIDNTWGMQGYLGRGPTAGFNNPPGYVLGPGAVPLENVKYVNAGRTSMCALTYTNEVYCWGGNNVGQLGNGTGVPFSNIAVKASLPEPAKSVEVGYMGACALGQSDKVYCWGLNDKGQLGPGFLGGFSNVPIEITGI